MKTIVLCVFFFIATRALPTNQDEPRFKRLYVDPMIDDLPKGVDPRITHGKEVVPHSIPYQAYLIVSSAVGRRWLCGGSLISPKHVLTAGHCLSEGSIATVYLGSHNIQQAESTRVIVQSENLIIHKDYDATRISNDIGVIVLSEPVELNDKINVVSLPSHGNPSNYEGTNVRVSGWGRVIGDGETSPVLLEVNSTVISNTMCSQVFPYVIDSQLCISGAGGVGSCNGDSGGPLLSGNNQIGIVSYGAKGCLSGIPSAFTRVTSYLDWLEEHTGLAFFI